MKGGISNLLKTWKILLLLTNNRFPGIRGTKKTKKNNINTMKKNEGRKRQKQKKQ